MLCFLQDCPQREARPGRCSRERWGHARVAPLRPARTPDAAAVPPGSAPPLSRRSPGAPSTPRHPGVEHFKRPSEVIFASTAANTVRARLDASCSLVSLAVQSLRSM
ncbi:hypothetical protein FF041_19180 [Streptomyces jumonjinensis]|uniref:Uncharacterized protein n=1 Tax=Streptomyces jumonjinensis TaxID=1945 RepID=A0A646KJJ6_STRJU|nr:hypothetical protein [Streptomyces jumonjinensis]